MVRTWLFSAIGLLIAAWIVPGAHINGFWAALLVAAVIAALNAILPPIIAAIRLPLTLVFGFLAILVVDALMLLAADAITDERMKHRRLLVGAPRRVPRLGGDPRDRGRRRGRRRQRVLVPGRPAHRSEDGGAGPHGRTGDRLPRDRRARASGPAPCDARRQRAAHGALARRGRLHAERLGDRPLLPDRRQPGRDPARLERRHSRVPLGREGGGDGDVVLRARRTAPSSSGGTRATRDSCSTAAPAAATCSRARRRR